MKEKRTHLAATGVKRTGEQGYEAEVRRDTEGKGYMG